MNTCDSNEFFTSLLLMADRFLSFGFHTKLTVYEQFMGITTSVEKNLGHILYSTGKKVVWHTICSK